MPTHPISSGQLNDHDLNPPFSLSNTELKKNLTDENCMDVARELLQASYESIKHAQHAPTHTSATEPTEATHIITPLSLQEGGSLHEQENTPANKTDHTSPALTHPTPTKQKDYQTLQSISDLYASPETIDFEKIKTMLHSIPKHHIVKSKNLFQKAWKSMFKYYLLDHYKSVPTEKTLMATALKELETQTHLKNTDHLYCFVSGVALPFLKSQESFKTYLHHQHIQPEKTLHAREITELKHNLDEMITLCDGSREFIKLFISMLPDKAKENLFKKLSDKDQLLLVHLSPEKPERIIAFNQSMQRIGAVATPSGHQTGVSSEEQNEVKRKLKF